MEKEGNMDIFRLGPSLSQKEKINRHIKNIENKYQNVTIVRKVTIESMRGVKVIDNTIGIGMEESRPKYHKYNVSDGKEKTKIVKTNKGNNQPTVRPRPSVKIISIIRYQLCRHFKSNKRCDRGDKCVFAHSTFELDTWNQQLKKKRESIKMPTKIKHILTPRLTPPILANKGTEYKMCKQINKSDFCSYGNKCKFAHSSEA